MLHFGIPCLWLYCASLCSVVCSHNMSIILCNIIGHRFQVSGVNFNLKSPHISVVVPAVQVTLFCVTHPLGTYPVERHIGSSTWQQNYSLLR